MFKKSFFIMIDEALQYPSSKEICKYISAYSEESGEQLTFVSTDNPVTFYLDSHLYEATIGMARGGYIIRCVEKK